MDWNYVKKQITSLMPSQSLFFRLLFSNFRIRINVDLQTRRNEVNEIFQLLDFNKTANPNIFKNHPSYSVALDYFYEGVVTMLDQRLLSFCSPELINLFNSFPYMQEQKWLASNLRFIVNFSASPLALVIIL